MKEHYCTYEQSRALKRLGFAEKVNHGYLKKISIEPEVSVGDLKEVHSKDPKNYNDNRKGAGKGLFFYSAPRLDQAAAWLRVCKKIFVGVNCENFPDAYISDMEPCYFPRIINLSGCIVKSKYWNDNLYTDEPKWFNDYEKALSAGISAALELLGKEVKE